MPNPVATQSLSNPKLLYLDVTLASGTQTPAVDLLGASLSTVFIPSGIQSVTMTPLKCDTLDGNYYPMIDGLGRDVTAGTAYVFTITQNGWVNIPADVGKSIRFLRLSFNTTETNMTYILGYRAIE